MQTVNISLPDKLARKIDQVVGREEYASRSEFIRALVRFYLLAEREEEIKLLPFRRVSLRSVEAELKRSG